MNEAVNDTRADLEPVRRRSRALIGLAVAGALVAAGLGTWLALRPDAPSLLGSNTASGFSADPRPLRSASGFAGIALPGPGSHDEILLFHGVPKVHFRTNTAHATARVAVCVRARGEDPYGAAPATDLATACTEVRYIKSGTRMHWLESKDPGAMREYLIVVVTPTRPGTASVDKVTYDYEDEDGHSGKDSGTLHYSIRAS